MKTLHIDTTPISRVANKIYLLINNYYIYLILIAIAACIIKYSGYGVSDNNTQLPLLYRFLDPNYLLNDWYVNSNSEMVNVRYNFIAFIAIINKIIPQLELLYFMIFVICYICAGFSAYFISLTFFKNRIVAILSSFLVLFGATYSLGYNQLLHDNLVPYLVAMALSLLGFYFILKRRFILFSIMLGLSSVIHFLTGGLIYPILFISSFLTRFGENNNLRNHIVSLMIFIIFFSFNIPIIFSQIENSVSMSTEELVFIYGIFRAPHHLMPSSFPVISYVMFFIFFILFAVALRKTGAEKEYREFIEILLCLIFLSFMIGTIFVEIFPVGLILKLQLFRLSTLITFIGYMFISEYIIKEVSYRRSNFHFLIYVALALSLLTPYLFFYYFFLFAAINIIETNSLSNRNKTIFLIIALFVIASLSSKNFIVFSTSIWPFNQGMWLIESKAGKELIASFIALFAFYFINNKSIRHSAIIISLIACLLFILSIPSTLHYTTCYDPYTEDVYGFIKDSSPPDSVFLTPPYIETFRLGAERAIVVDFKGFIFSEESMREWYSRIRNVSNNKELKNGFSSLESLRDGYNSLSEEDLLRLEDKYNISYALFQKPKELKFSTFFENENYIVYEINS